MELRRGVRRLAASLFALSCLVPSGAEAQSSTDATTTTRNLGQVADAVSGVAPPQPGATTTTTGNSAQAAGIGRASAPLQGGTTTTTLPPMANGGSSNTDPTAPAPTDLVTESELSPPPDGYAPAPQGARPGLTAFGPVTSPVEAPIDGATTTAVASPPSLVIADSGQVALPEELDVPVQLPGVGSDAQRFLSTSMMLLAIVLLVAPPVIEARRRRVR